MMALARTIIIISLLCCVNGSLAQQSSNKQATGSISGQITSAGSPAQGIVVMLLQSDSESMIQIRMSNRDQKALAKTTTDQDGKFTFNGLPAGSYVISPASATLALVSDGTSTGVGKQINLAEGETIDDVKISVACGGVITGRVTDQEGRPVISERLSLHRVTGMRQSTPIYLANSFLTDTDDRGIYRIYGLPPGRYRVSAGVDIKGDNAVVGLGRSVYERTFHPDETDEWKGTIIEITPGSEAASVDIKLGKLPKTFSISGRVIYADTGQPVEGATCGYGIINSISQQIGSSMFSGKTDKAGFFQLQRVMPGRYAAFSMIEGGSDYYSEAVPFKITDDNIEGIEIRLHRGSSISGVVVVEGTDDPEILAKVSQVQVGIYALGELRAPMSGSSNIGPDGNFRIGGIKPGKVRISAYSFPPQRNFQVIGIEGSGLSNSAEIEVTEGAAISDIRIVMAYGTGRVRGQVKIESGTIPEGSRFLISLFRTNNAGTAAQYNRPTEVDNRGRFEINGIVPGDYQFMLFLQAPSGGYRVASQSATVANNTETEIVFVVDPKTLGKERDQ